MVLITKVPKCKIQIFIGNSNNDNGNGLAIEEGPYHIETSSLICSSN